jgi:hypothetical protein
MQGRGVLMGQCLRRRPLVREQHAGQVGSKTMGDWEADSMRSSRPVHR